jgi:hypothetical protein
MFGGSFRLPARPVGPLGVIVGRSAVVLIVAAVPLAACGGTSRPAAPVERIVSGPGFRFAAPIGWDVRQTATSVEAREGLALVSATEFPLLKPYSPALFGRAVKELNGVAAQLAAQSKGALTESVTTTVDGRRIRAYRFTGRPASGSPYDERIGFVLEGKEEYQLLCQAAVGTGDPDGSCALLFSSFRVG